VLGYPAFREPCASPLLKKKRIMGLPEHERQHLQHHRHKQAQAPEEKPWKSNPVHNKLQYSPDYSFALNSPLPAGSLDAASNLVCSRMTRMSLTRACASRPLETGHQLVEDQPRPDCDGPCIMHQNWMLSSAFAQIFILLLSVCANATNFELCFLLCHANN
jgi:hypothetical protein